MLPVRNEAECLVAQPANVTSFTATATAPACLPPPPAVAAWGEAALDKEDAAAWAGDWDDEEAETDFDKQLRAELASNAAPAGAASSAASGGAAAGNH
jgi:hypothetical protein